ncbi:MAG: MarR family winged helix-turn-helix transcriptional regulator [Candidatus Limivicinus sp.]|jgi:DNA-binding MarR family transcriptional regulator
MDSSLEVSLNGSEMKKLLELQFNEVREKFDLKKVEVDVLYYLSQHRDYDTPTDIFCRLKLNRGHVSQAIDSLCRRGYIEPLQDKRDRRYMHYATTAAAQEAIDDITRVHETLNEYIFKGVTAAEVQTYRKVCRKICDNLKEMLE